MDTLINIAFFTFILLVGAIGFLKGRNKTWQTSLVKLFVIILSALISVFVSKAISKTVSDSVYTVIATKVFSDDIRELVSSIASLPEIMKAIISIILAPIIFYPVLLVVRIILAFFKPLLLKLIMLLTGLISNPKGKRSSSESTKKTKSNPTNESEEAQIDDLQATEEENDKSISNVTIESTTESIEDKNENIAPTSEKKKFFTKGSLAGALLGICSALAAWIVFLAPITGTLEMLGTLEDTVKESQAASIEEFAPIFKIVDPLTHNAGIKTINALGGKGIYNTLTSSKANTEKIKLDNEISFLTVAANTALTFTDEKADNSEKATALKELVPAFEKSNILPMLMAEFLSNASGAWEKGEDYCGISAPTVENAQFELILNELYSLFKNSTNATVSKDVSTIVNILAIAIEKGITDLPEDDPLAILKNKELTSALLFEFISNTHLNPLIKSFTSMGLSMICEAIGIPENYDGIYENMISEISNIDMSLGKTEVIDNISNIFHKYGIDIDRDSSEKLFKIIQNDNNYLLSNDKISYIKNLLSTTKISFKDIINNEQSVTLDEPTFELYSMTVTTETLTNALKSSAITDAKRESDALADVFASVSDFTAIGENEEDVVKVIRTIGRLLDKLASTDTIGKTCVDDLIIALMQSDVTESMMAMNDTEAARFALSIISATKDTGYESVMNSIANAVEALSLAKDSTSAETLLAVLETLTPETASALKHLITPDVMGSIGIEGEKAEVMSNIISNIFDNIAEAKTNGITEEEYNAEIEMVSDIINVTMSMASGSSSPDEIFGDSAEAGNTVQGYVNNVMDSEIIGTTIIDSVYGDSDTPKMDPLGANVELSESEETVLLDTINEKLSEADESEKEETEKKLTAIAAFVNVKIDITDGVARIVP